MNTRTYLGLNNGFHTALNVCLEDMSFGEFLVPVSSQPDPGQGALLTQHKMCIEHDWASLKQPDKRRNNINIISKAYSQGTQAQLFSTKK